MSTELVQSTFPLGRRAIEPRAAMREHPLHARRDIELFLVLLIAPGVLVPRGAVIALHHGPTFVENYHLYRGLLFLRQDQVHLQSTRWNDPPLGEALSAIPAWLNRVQMANPIYSAEYSFSVPPAKYCYVLPTSIRVETAIWKSILFVPGLAVTFVWLRSIYSSASSWLGTSMVLIEPMLAAHLPLPALDGLATEAIVIAAWAAWRFVCEPTAGRQFAASATMALALLLKHTVVLLPAAALLMAGIAWFGRRATPGELGCNLKKMAVAAALVPPFVWIFMRGDVSVPQDFADRPIFAKNSLLASGIPTGLYVESIWEGMVHVAVGEQSYLLGHESMKGWWYYFPVVATYKVPIGIGAVLLLGLISLLWIKPRYEEWPLAIGALLWTATAMLQHIDIGFRHFLPALIFWLMLGSRAASSRHRIWPALCWLFLAASAVDTARWSPDFLTYLNFPRAFAWVDISDSNLDWGQATLELREWIQNRPNDGRPIYVVYFGPQDQNLFKELGPRLTAFNDNAFHWVFRSPAASINPLAQPSYGIFLISEVLAGGHLDTSHQFTELHEKAPDGIIGHCILVYDLDRISHFRSP
jgi:hypothetical protein